MLGTCVVFGLLLWFPGLLNAQKTGQPCQAPSLDHGYFVPQKKTYLHEEWINYACEKGYKRVLGGWWATSKCLDGKWSHNPQCIDENDCAPPTIPNGTYDTNPNGCYEEGEVIRVTCDLGHEHENRVATAKCINGTWSTIPVCVISPQACSHPPQIPHGVIVGQSYSDVFNVDSSVEYRCKEGYTLKGTDSDNKIFCLSGNWTTVPNCIKTSGQHVTSGTSPGTSPGMSSGTSPGTSSGTSSGTSPGTSSGTSSGTSPGTSTATGGSTDTKDKYHTITRCGKRPVITHAAIAETTMMYLRYQCVRYFKLVGPDTVYCRSSGLWTSTPVCQANFCYLNTALYPTLEDTRVHFLENGETRNFICVNDGRWLTEHETQARCSNTVLTFTKCCSWLTPQKLC